MPPECGSVVFMRISMPNQKMLAQHRMSVSTYRQLDEIMMRHTCSFPAVADLALTELVTDRTIRGYPNGDNNGFVVVCAVMRQYVGSQNGVLVIVGNIVPHVARMPDSGSLCLERIDETSTLVQ